MISRALVVLVAGTPPVGFARLEEVDGQAHLEQLSVHLDDQRQGIGSDLLEEAARWAADHGYRHMTLLTDHDVPWNMAFYAHRRFAELTELTPQLLNFRERERLLGLDELGSRVVMRKELGTSAE